MSEQGNALNVAHFEELISRCVGFGGVYKPSNTAIEVANLQVKLTAASSAMDDVGAKAAIEDAMETDRSNLFKPLGTLVRRSVNYYESTGTAANKVDDAKGFKRKIEGKRASAPPVDDPATPEDESLTTISVSQQSYTQKVEHLEGLIGVYNNDALYKPNEADLTSASLTTYAIALKTANTSMIDALTNSSNSRLARNVEMYHKITGMCALAGMVKKYVKGLFGPSSPEYKQISGLSFRKQKL